MTNPVPAAAEPTAAEPTAAEPTAAEPSDTELLGAERYVLMTTFRKTGVGVPTAVWVGRDGDTLLVTTRDDAGKVKRVRNNGRVELTPCDIRGNVEEGAKTYSGTAEVFTDPDTRATLTEIFSEKYAERWFEMRAASDKRDPKPVSVSVRITLN